MSRITAKGIHPKTKEKVAIAFGYDCVPGFAPGYFFQAFKKNDPDETYVNEGFLKGISKERLDELMTEWSVGNN